jgi:hypothetical protein
MKRKLKIGDIVMGTHGPMELIEDFLPPPEELVFKGSKQEKITITIDSETLEFFRSKAKQLKAPYQRMIRNLLQQYVKMQG